MIVNDATPVRVGDEGRQYGPGFVLRWDAPISATAAAILMGLRDEPAPHPFRFDPEHALCAVCGGELVQPWHA